MDTAVKSDKVSSLHRVSKIEKSKCYPKKFKNLLHTTPFRPVRVHVSDGKSYDVKHHDFFWLFPHKLVIAIPSKRPGVMEKDVHISLLHITSIEEIRTRAKAKS